MRKKMTILCLLGLAVLALLVGRLLWGSKTEQEDDRMETGVELLMETGKLDRDSAEGSLEVLRELGAAPLRDAEKLGSQYGTALRVTDRDGRVFYLGYGGLGYLEIVRKGAPDGEILYAPED